MKQNRHPSGRSSDTGFARSLHRQAEQVVTDVPDRAIRLVPAKAPDEPAAFPPIAELPPLSQRLGEAVEHVVGRRVPAGDVIQTAAWVGAAAFMLLSVLQEVPRGAVGLRHGLAGPGDEVLMPGRHLAMPFFSEIQLYSTGEITAQITTPSVTSVDQVEIAPTVMSVSYLVNGPSMTDVAALDSSSSDDARGVRLPLQERMVREAQSTFDSMIGMVSAADANAKRNDMKVLLQEDLQSSFDAVLPGAVRVVSVDIGRLEPMAKAGNVEEPIVAPPTATPVPDVTAAAVSARNSVAAPARPAAAIKEAVPANSGPSVSAGIE